MGAVPEQGLGLVPERALEQVPVPELAPELELVPEPALVPERGRVLALELELVPVRHRPRLEHPPVTLKLLKILFLFYSFFLL